MVTPQRYQRDPVKHRAASTLYYATHPKARADNLLRVIADKIRRRIIVNAYKAMGCTDCGEQDAVVLEFDHVRGQKLGNVSMMIYRSSWGNLIREMNKCDIRCANCHARITAQRRYESSAVVS